MQQWIFWHVKILLFTRKTAGREVKTALPFHIFHIFHILQKPSIYKAFPSKKLFLFAKEYVILVLPVSRCQYTGLLPSAKAVFGTQQRYTGVNRYYGTVYNLQG